MGGHDAGGDLRRRLHVFAHMACKYDDEKIRGEGAAVFWEAFVAAAQAGKAWTPLRSLSLAQQSAGARLDAMPWALRRTPTAGTAHSAAQAQLPEGPAAGTSSAQAEAEREELRAAARWRAEAKQRREERGGRRTIGGGGRRGAKWRPPTPESCRLRGSSRGGQDGRGTRRCSSSSIRRF